MELPSPANPESPSPGRKGWLRSYSLSAVAILKGVAARKSVTIGGVVLGLIVYSPWIYMQALRLTHPSAIRCSDRIFPVPSGWAHVGNGGAWSGIEITFMHWPENLLPPFRMSEMSFSRETSPRSSAIKPLTAISKMAQMARADGDRVVGPWRVGQTGDSSWCFSQTNRQYAGFMTINCTLFRGTWFADYIGWTDRSNDFLALIRQIRPVR